MFQNLIAFRIKIFYDIKKVTISLFYKQNFVCIKSLLDQIHMLLIILNWKNDKYSLSKISMCFLFMNKLLN